MMIETLSGNPDIDNIKNISNENDDIDKATGAQASWGQLDVQNSHFDFKIPILIS